MRIISTIAVLVAACSHNVYTPPTRAFPLETPQTIGDGDYGVQLEASAHGNGPKVGAGALRLRRGIADNAELDAELTYAKASDATTAPTQKQLIAARAGGKLRSDELPELAVTGGLGGGTFAGGPYVTADAGAVVAYDTCRVTPFVGGMGYLSTPLDARPVDTTQPDMPAGMFVDTPETTAGVQLRIGIKLNLSSCEDRRTAVVAGFGVDHFWDDDSDRGYASGGAAISIDLK